MVDSRILVRLPFTSTKTRVKVVADSFGDKYKLCVCTCSSSDTIPKRVPLVNALFEYKLYKLVVRVFGYQWLVCTGFILQSTCLYNMWEQNKLTRLH